MDQYAIIFIDEIGLELCYELYETFGICFDQIKCENSNGFRLGSALLRLENK